MEPKLSQKKIYAAYELLKSHEAYGLDPFDKLDRKWFVDDLAMKLRIRVDGAEWSPENEKRYLVQAKRYFQYVVKSEHPIRTWFNNLKYRILLNHKRNGK